MLVPEIALTPQALNRFEARFGDVVAVMHSGMGQGERYDEWQRLAAGEARVAVGPRSAVFAPLTDIGLVIVDEEHEGSYKHEGDPRYDARAVAERRARDHGAVLLLGTATPRPESVRATSTRLRLPSRIDGRPLPPVEILDMRGQHHPLHPRTRHALADLRRGERQGDRAAEPARLVELPLVPILRPGVDVPELRGRARAPPRRRLRRLSPLRASRARSRAAAARARRSPSPATARAPSGSSASSPRRSADPASRCSASTPTPAGLAQRAQTLERFQAARAGVLVGTQMVAKGHDFPDVALGIVLDADQTLRFPDFRAEERTFALITQLAGRAGRGEQEGRVLVQTLAPDARSIRFAAAPRCRRLRRRRADATRGARLPAVRVADPDRLRGG